MSQIPDEFAACLNRLAAEAGATAVMGEAVRDDPGTGEELPPHPAVKVCFPLPGEALTVLVYLSQGTIAAGEVGARFVFGIAVQELKWAKEHKRKG